MKPNQYLGIVAIALVAGIVGAVAIRNVAPQLVGDFAGGITPSQLFTANTGTSSVTPILNNLYVNGGISVGGASANNQITALYTATAWYPTVTLTIGSSTFTTAATTTQIGFSASGFAVGDSCEVTYTGTTSTLIESATVTAVSGSNVTSTISFLNVNGVTVPLPVTSTVTGVSSTLKTTCFHTGV